VLQRVLGLGYQSDWAKSHLPTRAARNAFYTRAGALIPPGKRGADQLRNLDPTLSPDEILKTIDVKRET
jgi:hypothetical protein